MNFEIIYNIYLAYNLSFKTTSIKKKLQQYVARMTICSPNSENYSCSWNNEYILQNNYSCLIDFFTSCRKNILYWDYESKN